MGYSDDSTSRKGHLAQAIGRLEKDTDTFATLKWELHLKPEAQRMDQALLQVDLEVEEHFPKVNELIEKTHKASLDEITELISQIFDSPIAYISLLDDTTQFFKSIVGLDLQQADREIAFCKYTIQQQGILEVTDASTDSRFHDHPMVIGEPYVRHYVGIPLENPSGVNIGTLCALDFKAKELTPVQRKSISVLAKQVENILRLIQAERHIEHLKETAFSTGSLLNDVSRIGKIGGWEMTIGVKGPPLWTAETYNIHGIEVGQLIQVEESINCYSGEARVAIGKAFQELVSKAVEYDLILPFTSCDGVEKIIRTTGKKSIHGTKERLYGTIQDVTDAEKRKEQLKELSKFFELSSDPISVADIDGYFTTVNPAFTKLTGYTHDELTSQPYRSFIHPDDDRASHRYIDEITRIGATAVESYTNRYITKSGETIWLEWKSFVDYQEKKIYSTSRDITKQQKTLIEIAKSERLHKALIESLSEGVVLHDRGGKIIDCNQSALDITGLTEQQLKQVDLFDPKCFAFKPDGSDILGENHPTNVTLTTGEPVFGQQMGINKVDGTQAWLLVNAVPVKQEEQIKGVVTTFTDITNRVKNQQEIEVLALVVKNTPNGVVITDEHQEIEWCNEAFETISEYTMEELKGKKTANLLDGPNTNMDARKLLSQAAKKGKRVGTEIMNYSKSGRPYWVHIDIHPIMDQNQKVSRFFSVQTEITDRVQREEDMKRKNAQLSKANSELDNFVYRVSHDLRAPIASSLGLLFLMKQSTNIAEIGQLIDMQHGSMERMDQFVNDILDHSRNTRLELKQELINLRDFAVEVTESFGFLEETKKVDIQFDIDQELVLITDKIRLKVILHNLISNGIKYADHSANNSYVLIKGRLTSQEALITIEDNGIGIRNEHLEDVFKMFFRSNSDRTGSGLGLYIVNEAVDKLKGNITIHSQPNVGTSVNLIIPQQQINPDYVGSDGDQARLT